MDKHLLLISALKEGKILYKHFSKVDSNQFLFLENERFEVKGWRSAIDAPSDLVTDIVLNPEQWEIHSHKLSDGYPYPWSSTYKK